MTVICAVHQAGVTHIASDRRIRSGDVFEDYAPKWVVDHSREWAIGVAGEARVGALIDANRDRFRASDGPFHVGQNLRHMLKEDGFAPYSDGKPGAFRYPCSFIFANRRGVWGICSGGSVSAAPEGVLMTDGSGDAEASGAWYALQHMGMPASLATLEVCIKAAIARDSACGGDPFYMALL